MNTKLRSMTGVVTVSSRNSVCVCVCVRWQAHDCVNCRARERVGMRALSLTSRLGLDADAPRCCVAVYSGGCGAQRSLQCEHLCQQHGFCHKDLCKTMGVLLVRGACRDKAAAAAASYRTLVFGSTVTDRRTFSLRTKLPATPDWVKKATALCSVLQGTTAMGEEAVNMQASSSPELDTAT